jgi:hypothetical protein
MEPTEEAFPTGWALDKHSWEFNRTFYRQWQRPLNPGEYAFLFRQIRHHTGVRLGHQVWRLTLPSGCSIVVNGSARGLYRVLQPDWVSREREVVVAPPLPPPAPPAPQPTRLQLGNRTVAGELLAARLRRWG